MEQNKPLLSICIPTYNRAKFLDESLRILRREFDTLSDSSKVELIVSDNCSTDNTASIVAKHIKGGLPVKYIRNLENLGMDGNFAQCFKEASGSYIWLLGDDDYLAPGSLKWMLDLLRNTDFGLIHICAIKKKKADEEYHLFNSPNDFLLTVNYWITFISGNIVSSKYVPDIEFDKYSKSLFSQIPLYLTSTIESKENAIVYKQILEEGKDSSNNGGYNLFEVFVVNFLNIWKEQTETLCDSKKLYKRIKAILYKNFLVNYILTLLLSKNTTRFKTDGAWRILWKYYGKEPYAYYYFVIGMAKFCCKKIIKLLK